VHLLHSVCSYRLAPKVTFPVSFEDCLKATQYFFSHADVFGVDTKRLAVAGLAMYTLIGVTVKVCRFLGSEGKLSLLGPFTLKDFCIAAL